MVIAWQVLNKVAGPQDPRFSRNVLVVAPGLTVRSRLGVLESAGADNYYETFNIVPSALLDNQRRGKVLIRNLDEWTQAVNAYGGFGRWRAAVAKAPGEIRDILMQNQPMEVSS